MRVLFAGSCSTFFLVPLVQALKKVDPNFSASVIGLNNPAGEIQAHEAAVFEELIPYPSENISGSKVERLKESLKLISKKNGSSKVLKLLASGQLKSAITNAETELVQNANNAEITRLSEPFDLVHVHYLKHSNLKLASNFDARKTLLSFWGSDLLQDEGDEARALKIELMEKINLITVQNEDLAQIIALKYGWKFKSKIRTNLFLPNSEVLKSIADSSKEEARAFLNQFGEIENQKKVIVTGYNPNPQSQQLEILKQLQQVSESEFSKKHHFLFTFIYSKGGQREEMIETVKAMGCSFSIVDRYLSDHEMGLLRKATDIYLHFPQTDAFSTSLLEHLYAQNTVVTGSWLPYGKHRVNEIFFREIESIDELSNEHLLESEKSQLNTEKINALIAKEKTAETWLKIYSEAQIEV